MTSQRACRASSVAAPALVPSTFSDMDFDPDRQLGGLRGAHGTTTTTTRRHGLGVARGQGQGLCRSWPLGKATSPPRLEPRHQGCDWGAASDKVKEAKTPAAPATPPKTTAATQIGVTPTLAAAALSVIVLRRPGIRSCAGTPVPWPCLGVVAGRAVYDATAPFSTELRPGPGHTLTTNGTDVTAFAWSTWTAPSPTTPRWREPSPAMAPRGAGGQRLRGRAGRHRPGSGRPGS